jgi:hypothetical protein
MAKRAEPVPNPGSPEAVAEGCTCPVSDNAHGRGAGTMPSSNGLPTRVFVFHSDCPLHGAGDWKAA